MKAPRFWRKSRLTLTARALFPIGALVGAVTAKRMARAGRGVGVPVLCIGNFVVGGAGKTPAAIAIAKLMQGSGERVAFLSRGYGGASRAAPLAVDLSLHNAREVGDEPLLLARVAPCFVGPDRVASAMAAIETGANLLVMDDGLQNPSLKKDISIAVVDGESPFGNGLCLPAGPLRAPLAVQMRHADAILVIGGDAVALAEVRAKAQGRPVFTARLQPDAVAASPLIGRPVLAFAGIARPEKFFDSLVSLGATVVAAKGFPDHHAYSAAQIEALLRVAARRNLLPVTTEKDYVRIPGPYAREILTLPVTLRLDDPRGLSKLIASALGRKAARFP